MRHLISLITLDKLIFLASVAVVIYFCFVFNICLILDTYCWIKTIFSSTFCLSKRHWMDYPTNLLEIQDMKLSKLKFGNLNQLLQINILTKNYYKGTAIWKGKKTTLWCMYSNSIYTQPSLHSIVSKLKMHVNNFINCLILIRKFDVSIRK